MFSLNLVKQVDQAELLILNYCVKCLLSPVMRENVYLKWRICEALGLQMIVVLKRLNVGKHLKNINSALSLLHDVSVTCCQFSSGEIRLIIAQYSTLLKFRFDARLSHLGHEAYWFTGSYLCKLMCLSSIRELISNHKDATKITTCFHTAVLSCR